MHTLPPAPSSQRQRLDELQTLLRAQYLALVEAARPLVASRREASRRQGRRRRISDSPSRSTANRVSRPSSSSDEVSALGRVFVVLLLVHAVVVGGLLLWHLTDSQRLLKIAGGVILAWLLFKAVQSACRHLPRRRRVTSRLRHVRPADRDIWL